MTNTESEQAIDPVYEGRELLDPGEVEFVNELTLNYQQNLEAAREGMIETFGTGDLSNLPDDLLEKQQFPDQVARYVDLVLVTDDLQKGNWLGVARYYEKTYEFFRDRFAEGEEVPKFVELFLKRAELFKEFASQTPHA